jgi:hypothetical protein
MVTASVDAALIDVAAAAREATREAKRERARAMDAITELLLERAEARALLAEAIQYIGFVRLADDIRQFLGEK